jgi:hypothetical protein
MAKIVEPIVLMILSFMTDVINIDTSTRKEPR